MKVKIGKEHLIIVLVFVIIAAIATVTFGIALYEPPVEIVSFTAEVYGFDETANVLLVLRQNGFIYELLGEPIYLSADGLEIDARDFLPGQPVRVYHQLKSSPAIMPKSAQAEDSCWFCVKVEMI